MLIISFYFFWKERKNLDMGTLRWIKVFGVSGVDLGYALPWEKNLIQCFSNGHFVPLPWSVTDDTQRNMHTYTQSCMNISGPPPFLDMLGAELF